MKPTFVYIDGFNLYYRLKHYDHLKWLNLRALVEDLLTSKDCDVKKIKYFTARAKRVESDPDLTMRQQMYFDAIQTISNLEIVLGNFQKRNLKGLLCNSDQRNKIIMPPKIVTIQKYEEKKSDVNIAVHMIADGYLDRYEHAVLVSNDADLELPVSHIKESLKKFSHVISPYGRINDALKKSSSFYQTIRKMGVFERNQFPATINTPSGKRIVCPDRWLPKVPHSQ